MDLYLHFSICLHSLNMDKYILGNISRGGGRVFGPSIPCCDAYWMGRGLESFQDVCIRIETCCPNTIINVIKFCCV